MSDCILNENIIVLKILLGLPSLVWLDTRQQLIQLHFVSLVGAFLLLLACLVFTTFVYSTLGIIVDNTFMLIFP